MAANGGMKWLSATVSVAIAAISGTVVEPSLVASTNFNGKISNWLVFTYITSSLYFKEEIKSFWWKGSRAWACTQSFPRQMCCREARSNQKSAGNWTPPLFVCIFLKISSMFLSCAFMWPQKRDSIWV